jgi:iron complex outermembrane recepter protein
LLQVAGINESVSVTVSTPLDLTRPEPTASRLNLTPFETPASVAVISGDTIRDLGTPTLIQAKGLAPGITSSATPGNGGNVLTSRGFTGSNSVKQLFNGLEIYNGGNVVSFPFDPWNVDHVAVLYGPSSVLYGTGAIGGAVNVVPKRPDPNSTHGEALIGGGRFGTFNGAFDLTGPINGKFSYRVDVSARHSNHWVDRGELSSLAVSGSLRWDARQNLRFTLANDYGDQNPSKYLGTPVLNAAPVTALRYKNYNLADSQLNFTDNWTTLETDWTISPNLTFHNVNYFLFHDRIYRDVTIFTYLPATQQVRRTTYRHIDDTWQTQSGDTGYIKYAGRLFGRRNDVLVGFDGNRNYYHRNDNVRGGTSIVDAFNFNPGNYRAAYQLETVPFYRMHVNQYGGFFEDRLTLTEQFSLVMGLRRDRYKVHRFDNITTLTTHSTHNSTAWNGGAVYDVIPGLAAYAQYSVASEPVNSLAAFKRTSRRFVFRMEDRLRSV